MSIPLHDFLLFKEVQLWGAVEVTGVVIYSAGSTNLEISACWGAGHGTPESPSPLSRRAVSSFRAVEGPNSSSTSLKREASITSCPLMVINGAMHCWSSLMAPHRMLLLDPDVSAQACNNLAKAIVFCQMIWKFWGSEVGGEYPMDKAHVQWVGYPTIWRPLVSLA